MISVSGDKQADIIDAFNTTAVHPDIWMIFQTLIMFILAIW